MDDDLNTPRALAVIFDLCRDINRARDEGGSVDQAQKLLLNLGGILGLTFADDNDSKDIEAAPFIDLLISIRKELREAKQFSVADSIRDNLTALGVTLEDSPKGTTWKKH